MLHYIEVFEEMIEELEYMEKLLQETVMRLNNPFISKEERTELKGKLHNWRVSYDKILRRILNETIELQKSLKSTSNLRFMVATKIEKKTLGALRRLYSTR